MEGRTSKTEYKYLNRPAFPWHFLSTQYVLGEMYDIQIFDLADFRPGERLELTIDTSDLLTKADLQTPTVADDDADLQNLAVSSPLVAKKQDLFFILFMQCLANIRNSLIKKIIGDIRINRYRLHRSINQVGQRKYLDDNNLQQYQKRLRELLHATYSDLPLYRHRVLQKTRAPF